MGEKERHADERRAGGDFRGRANRYWHNAANTRKTSQGRGLDDGLAMGCEAEAAAPLEGVGGVRPHAGARGGGR